MYAQITNANTVCQYIVQDPCHQTVRAVPTFRRVLSFTRIARGHDLALTLEPDDADPISNLT